MERVRQLHLERGATAVLKMGQYDAEATEELISSEPDMQPLSQDPSFAFEKPYIRQVGGCFLATSLPAPEILKIEFAQSAVNYCAPSLTSASV